MMTCIKFFAAGFFIFLFSACGTVEKPQPVEQTPPPEQKKPSFQITIKKPDKRNLIVDFAQNSIGLPYKWGGVNPKSGFDCSGLTYFTYQKVGVTLPRTARDQFEIGNSISKAGLKKADLVFFKHPYKSKLIHVGIYIGNGKFIHAPGKGRTVSYGSLTNPYFYEHFKGARSYLD